MTTKKAKGKLGEDLACSHLLNKGYKILARNWRHKRAEVDIIALNGTRLIIAEVKFRSTTSYEHPIDSVSDRQVEMLFEAADAFRDEHNLDGEIRFDIISVEKTPEGKLKITHVEDAFFPM